MIFLICLAAFIVSGDIFFVIPIGGFTLRIFQVLMVPILLKGLWDLFNRSVWPLGFGYLLLWTLFIVCFVPNTSFLDRSIFYALWLIFSVFMVLGLTCCIDTQEKLRTVLRWYVYSYGFSAAFGLSQLALPLVGLPPFLLQQWWFPGILARINGFTYEPSYFATYMIAGWITIDYLRYKKFDLPYLSLTYWMVTVALLLSGSRMGWTVMLGWWCLRTLWSLRAGVLPWRKVGISVFLAVVLLSSIVVSMGLRTADFSFLVNGLGVLEDAGSYSSAGRWDLAMQTLRVYLDHPFVGVSLGGVATAIGRQNNETISDNEDAKANEGQCTTAEVLAASGTVGFIFYVLYLVRLVGVMWRPPEPSAFVKSLGWGLIALMLMLQFNQNILRFYLWFQIGILSAAYRVESFSTEEALPKSVAPEPHPLPQNTIHAT
jgi:hypothetical protein